MTFSTLFKEGAFEKFCDYHSHPYGPNEDAPLLPSNCDMNAIDVGQVEVIVKVRRKRNNENWWEKREEHVAIAWGRYRFEIGAFMRTEGFEKKNFPLFKELRVDFIDG